MNNYVSQITHLDNGNSFEYVNYMDTGTWFKYGENIQNEGYKYKDSNSALRWIGFMNGDRYCK